MAACVMVCDGAPRFYYDWKFDDQTPPGWIGLGDLVGIVDSGRYEVMEAAVIGQDDHGPFITFRCEGGRRSYDKFDIDRFKVSFYRSVKYPGTDRLVMVGDTVEVDGELYEIENVLPSYNRVCLKPIGSMLYPISDIGYPVEPDKRTLHVPSRFVEPV